MWGLGRVFVPRNEEGTNETNHRFHRFVCDWFNTTGGGISDWVIGRNGRRRGTGDGERSDRRGRGSGPHPVTDNQGWWMRQGRVLIGRCAWFFPGWNGAVFYGEGYEVVKVQGKSEFILAHLFYTDKVDGEGRRHVC